MKLTELEPQFIRYETRIGTWTRVLGDAATWKPGDPTEDVTGPQEWTIQVETFTEAQGLWFLCPKCYVEKSGARGTHRCSVSFEGRGVQPDQGTHNSAGAPVRWNVQGDSFENLTIRPSILIEGGCGWHGFITNGEIT